MKKRILLFLAIVVLLPAAVQAAPPKKCNVIGIKNTGTSHDGQYITKSQRKLLKTAKRAEKKGFVAFSAAPSSPTGYSFALDGNEEVPPVTTSASGSCVAVHDSDAASLEIKCTHDAASPTAAHIHNAAIGANGGVICNLGDGTSPISANCALTDEQVTALTGGELYVNVHTTGNPSGELRGQIDNQ